LQILLPAKDKMSFIVATRISIYNNTMIDLFQ